MNTLQHLSAAWLGSSEGRREEVPFEPALFLWQLSVLGDFGMTLVISWSEDTLFLHFLEQ